jgi:transposase
MSLIPYLEHSEEAKGILIGGRKANLPMKQAAANARMPVSTGYKVQARYKARGTTQNKKRQGRPPALSPMDKERILSYARKNRRASHEKIKRDLSLQCSVFTIRRALKESKMVRRAAKRVPLLTKKHRADRMRWVRLVEGPGRVKRVLYGPYGRGGVFNRFIWSDECYFYPGNDGRHRVYVTRTPEERWDDDCLQQTSKQNAVRVMAWACIMHGVKGPLIFLEYPGGKGGGINAERYREQVLDPVLKDFFTQMKEKRGHEVVFMHDGAPAHRATATKRWFAENQIPLFFHPANSPDLNPIEPVWADIKRFLRTLPDSVDISDTETLKAHILMWWDLLPIEWINRYTGTMDRRLNAVKRANGGHTKY